MNFSQFAARIRTGRKSQQSAPEIFSEMAGEFRIFSVIFEVGAHHGNVLARFKGLAPNCQLHAFEPSQTSFEKLRARFGNDPQIVLNQKAVSNEIGVTPFYENNFDETNSLLPSVHVDENIDALTKVCGIAQVETTTLDSYALSKGISDIDFIKIDVQGSSFGVLEGAKSLLENKAVRWIYAEAEFVEIYKNERRFSEIELLMRSYGYSLVKFYNMNYTSGGRLAWADALFSAE
jgi:FkbM family methyltransferase